MFVWFAHSLQGYYEEMWKDNNGKGIRVLLRHSGMDNEDLNIRKPVVEVAERLLLRLRSDHSAAIRAQLAELLKVGAFPKTKDEIAGKVSL